MKKKVLVSSLIIVLLGGILFLSREKLLQQFFKPTSSIIETGINKLEPESIDTVAQDLVAPWEVLELPDGDLLITERPGRLRRVGQDNQRVQEIAGVEHVGEGGLLGLALHPNYEDNKQIYLYLTTQADDGLINRIESYRFENDILSDKKTIIDNIPGARVHDGGRIAFGPDNKLYVTTGDAGKTQLAQDTSSLAGKILRLNDDGSVPDDNPFNNPVYSYGHRNSQGIAWDSEGRLWSSEHGRSGASSGFDEINLIVKGGNYGWPMLEGDETAEGMIAPVVHSGAQETWAPAGLAYHDGSLYFTGLRGETLYEANIESADKLTLKAHFRGTYGRLRAVTATNDKLYISTSNQDGRGSPNAGDDKVLAIDWDIFK